MSDPEQRRGVEHHPRHPGDRGAIDPLGANEPHDAPDVERELQQVEPGRKIGPPDGLRQHHRQLGQTVHEHSDREQLENPAAMPREVGADPERQPLTRQRHQNQAEREQRDQNDLEAPLEEPGGSRSIDRVAGRKRREQHGDHGTREQQQPRREIIWGGVVRDRRNREHGADQKAVQIHHERADDAAHRQPSAKAQERPNQGAVELDLVSEGRQGAETEQEQGHPCRKPHGDQRTNDRHQTGGERQDREWREKREGAHRQAHGIQQVEALLGRQNARQPGHPGDDGERRGQHVEGGQHLRMQCGWDLEDSFHHHGREGPGQQAPDDAEGEKQGARGPEERGDLGVAPVQELHRHQARHGGTQPEVEQPEVSDQHPGEREHAEAVESQPADQPWDRDQGDEQWRALAEQAQRSVLRQQARAGEVRHHHLTPCRAALPARALMIHWKFRITGAPRRQE